MSRLKRLKEEKRKNRVKATSCGLALALMMVSAQGLGTYALFTDTEDVASELAISTGDVDVEVEKETHSTDVKPGDTIEMPVKIINKGTLNQNISLSLSVSSDIKKYLSQPKFKFEGINIKDNGVMYSDTGLFVLAPGESIDGIIEMVVNKDMSIVDQNSLAGIQQNVDLTVKSTQISDNSNEVFSNGFYDEVTQRNTITLAQRKITVAIGEKAHYINKNGNKYTSLFIPVNVNGMNEGNNDKIKITAVINGKIGSYEGEYVDKGIFKYIKITPVGENNFVFKDGLNITINITIGEDETYSQLCWINQVSASNSNCEEENHPEGEEDFRCHIEEVKLGRNVLNTHEETLTLDEIEPPKGEIEEPSEPEVVKPPKEEVEMPSEPEVVEPPKKEIEEPSEPEVVEQPKESEGIQE